MQAILFLDKSSILEDVLLTYHQQALLSGLLLEQTVHELQLDADYVLIVPAAC